MLCEPIVQVICDKCGEILEIEGHYYFNLKRLPAALEEYSWIIINDQHFCGDCHKNGVQMV